MEGQAGRPELLGRGGPRPRLVSAELATEQDGRTRIRVTLEYGGREYVGQAAEVGDMVLHLSAEATIAALEQAIDRPGYFQLVGIKRTEAFDSSAVLVSVRTTDERSLTLLGTVRMEKDLVESVARSVLKATNRLVEAMRTPETDTG